MARKTKRQPAVTTRRSKLLPLVITAVVVAVMGVIFWQFAKQTPLDAIVYDAPFGVDYPRLRDYKSATRGPRVRVTMSEAQISDHFGQVITSVLDQAIEDPRELPFVRQQLGKLLEQMQKDRAIVDIALKSPPDGDPFACTYMLLEKRHITYFAPNFFQAEADLKPEAYHDKLVFAVVHEMSHSMTSLSTWRERVQDESQAWVATMPVIRSWYASGRHPGSAQWKISKFFHDVCNDNPNDERWLELIARQTHGEKP